MVLFESGNRVAIAFRVRGKRKFDYKPGTIKRKHDINHYLVRLDDDNQLYICHTSKIVGISKAERVEIEEEN